MSGFQNALDAYNGLQAIDDKQRADRTSRQAGNMLAQGNYGGASQALYQGGYVDQGAAVEKAQTDRTDAQLKREAEGTLKLVGGMSQMIAAGADPKVAWTTARQYAAPLGLDPAHLDELQPYFEQDPKAFLAFTAGEAENHLKTFQHGGNIRGIDDRTGKQVWAYDMPPPSPQEQRMPFGWEMGENGPRPIQSVVQGRAQIASATRAPPRPRASGGRSAAIPPPPSGWSAR